VAPSVQRRKVWLTTTTRVPCSNAAKTRNSLKFAGMPETNETISAASGPKFTILWRPVEEILLLNKFFSDCLYKGVGPQKLKFLLRFHRNVEYKRAAGAYPWSDFHNICRVCTTFQDALGVKIWLDLLQGLWSYGGFKLRGSGFPQIFSAP